MLSVTNTQFLHYHYETVVKITSYFWSKIVLIEIVYSLHLSKFLNCSTFYDPNSICSVENICHQKFPYQKLASCKNQLSTISLIECKSTKCSQKSHTHSIVVITDWHFSFNYKLNKQKCLRGSDSSFCLLFFASSIWFSFLQINLQLFHLSHQYSGLVKPITL